MAASANASAAPSSKDVCRSGHYNARAVPLLRNKADLSHGGGSQIFTEEVTWEFVTGGYIGQENGSQKKRAALGTNFRWPA
jgi:hypothetical protein